MEEVIVYKGKFPKFALRRHWITGSSVDLKDFYVDFGNKCEVTDSYNDLFVKWLIDNYISKLGDDFEVIYPFKDYIVQIEAKNFAASASMEEAEARLKAIRHPDSVGHIEITKVETAIKDKKNRRFSVVTGDNLKSSSKTKDLPTREVTVLDQKLDKQRELDAELSSISNKINLIKEELLPGNKVERVNIGGTYTNKPVSNKNTIVNEIDESKVNKYFSGYQNTPDKLEISLEDLVGSGSDDETIRLIGLCKNHSVLRYARIYYSSNGKQRIVDSIDKQLRRVYK